MLQSVSVSENFPYEGFLRLVQEVYDTDAVIPLRDETYMADRLHRAVLEGGGIWAFYDTTAKKLKGICITEEREGTPAIVDMVCREEDKEALVQCYLTHVNLPAIREYIFPVMMKRLDERLKIPAKTKVFLNDEI